MPRTDKELPRDAFSREPEAYPGQIHDDPEPAVESDVKIFLPGEEQEKPEEKKIPIELPIYRFDDCCAFKYVTQKDIDNEIEFCKDVITDKDDYYPDAMIEKAKRTLEKYGVEIPGSKAPVREEKMETEPVAATEIPEKTVVEAFREKTDEMFHPLKSADTAAEIEEIVRFHAEQVFEDYHIPVTIDDVILTGSRCRGLETEGSDIDVVIAVDSDFSESAMFNALHDEEIEIDGIPIDINPILPWETGTLETYLPEVEKYLQEKAEKQNDVSITVETPDGDRIMLSITKEKGRAEE